MMTRAFKECFWNHMRGIAVAAILISIAAPLGLAFVYALGKGYEHFFPQDYLMTMKTQECEMQCRATYADKVKP